MTGRAEAVTTEQTSTMVSLTDDELAVLDGRCSEKVQQQVTAAHYRIEARTKYGDLTPAHAGFIADVVTEARATGLLVWQNKSIRHCSLCGKHAGYVKYKSGPRRGRENYDRPLHLPGRDLGWRFVTVRGSTVLGGCAECVDPLVPLLQEALRGVEAQVPSNLRAEGEPIRLRYDRKECPECGWRGHEGEMRRLRTVMGDGTYAGGCPACPFESRFLGVKHFKSLDGFDIVTKEKADADHRVKSSTVGPDGSRS